DTYAQAVKKSKEDPANWLLIYDLLADVSACLERIANPEIGRYRPQRFWDAGMVSPAAQLLAVMYAQQAMASQNALWNAGSGGDEGSFGGDGGFSGSDS